MMVPVFQYLLIALYYRLVLGCGAALIGIAGERRLSSKDLSPGLPIAV
jgi:hypothetical protein